MDNNKEITIGDNKLLNSSINIRIAELKKLKASNPDLEKDIDEKIWEYKTMLYKYQQAIMPDHDHDGPKYINETIKSANPNNKIIIMEEPSNIENMLIRFAKLFVQDMAKGDNQTFIPKIIDEVKE